MLIARARINHKDKAKWMKSSKKTRKKLLFGNK